MITFPIKISRKKTVWTIFPQSRSCDLEMYEIRCAITQRHIITEMRLIVFSKLVCWTVHFVPQRAPVRMNNGNSNVPRDPYEMKRNDDDDDDFIYIYIYIRTCARRDSSFCRSANDEWGERVFDDENFCRTSREPPGRSLLRTVLHRVRDFLLRPADQ